MSLSHHFQQQRKSDAVAATQQRVNNKLTLLSPQTQSKPVSSPPPQLVAKLVTPASTLAGSADIKALARAAREGTFGWEQETDAEVLLRKFDMTANFGPSTGISRRARWQRAESLGLNPPPYILSLLDGVFESSNGSSNSSSSSSSARGKPQAAKSAVSSEEQPQFAKGVGSFSFFHTEVLGPAQGR